MRARSDQKGVWGSSRESFGMWGAAAMGSHWAVPAGGDVSLPSWAMQRHRGGTNLHVDAARAVFGSGSARTASELLHFCISHENEWSVA